jgi:hypothetical protein
MGALANGQSAAFHTDKADVLAQASKSLGLTGETAENFAEGYVVAMRESEEKLFARGPSAPSAF